MFPWIFFLSHSLTPRTSSWMFIKVHIYFISEVVSSAMAAVVSQRFKNFPEVDLQAEVNGQICGINAFRGVSSFYGFAIPTDYFSLNGHLENPVKISTPVTGTLINRRMSTLKMMDGTSILCVFFPLFSIHH